jgi:hypothetical protein
MMFSGINPQTGKMSPRAHLAEIIGYLGGPPLHFLKCSYCYSAVFEDMGGIGEDPQPHPPSITLFNLQTS